MATGSRELESVMLEEGSSSLLQSSRCCFCFSLRRRSSSVGLAFWERIKSTQIKSGNALWVRGVRAFQKIREWSELVAGPGWKTFIRRFNRNRRGGCRHGKFQYDPLSYALNFDEGPGGQNPNVDDDNVYGGFRSFSVRYAAVPPRPNPGPGKSTAKPRKEEAVFV